MYGLESINSLFKSFDPDSFIARQMLSVRVANVLKQVCQSKRLRIDFQHCIHVECSANGIIINTTTSTIANRLKQVQPSLEKALFDNGLYLPIQNILAGKINPLPKDEPYPEGAPRVAQSGVAEAVRANAALAKDEEVRKSLERLADALRR